MDAAKSFALWVLQQVPAFLMSEPIIYIIGCVILLFIASLVINITRLK